MEPGDPSLQTLTLARAFGGPVHAVEIWAVDPFRPGGSASVLQQAGDEVDVTAVFAAGTDRGNDVMARLAARTGLPLAANCVAATPGDPVALTRQRWGGSLLEEAELHSPRPLITVAPHTVAASNGDRPVEVNVQPYLAKVEARDQVVRLVEHVAPPGGGVSLAEAKIVVSGGGGGGPEEGFWILGGRGSLARARGRPPPRLAPPGCRP